MNEKELKFSIIEEQLRKKLRVNDPTGKSIMIKGNICQCETNVFCEERLQWFLDYIKNNCL